MIYLITKQGACAATPDEPVAAELERVGYRRVELAEFEQVKGSPAWSSQMKRIRGRKLKFSQTWAKNQKRRKDI